jgi:hypothetical protein
MILTGAVFAAPSTIIEAPKNFTVELATSEDGYPYFTLEMQLPASVETLIDSINEDEASIFYEMEYKVGNGNWENAGPVHYTAGTSFVMHPYDMGINGNIDIKANVYEFRVRIGYYQFKVVDEYGNRESLDPIYSPYSNVASIGIKAYYKDASSWAIPELDKAVEYGFITEKIKDGMNQPITREELCEVIMKLYEKIVGPAVYTDLNSFVDTKNPEIYKAYNLGIVNGVGNSKFAPNDLTNREQVAAMMTRAVKAIKPTADFSTDGAESFKDESLISSWALDSIRFMNKNNLINGSDGYVNPKGTTTREQAVLIVVRTYEKFND